MIIIKIKKILSIVLALITLATIFLSSTLSICAETTSTDELGLGGVRDTRTPISDTFSENPTFAPYELPSSIDLSESNSFPQVRSQGGIGSCAAWATTYYQFGYQVAVMNGWNAKNDPTKQFSPKWTYNILGVGDYEEGISLESAYDLLSQQGAVKYSQFTPTGNKNDSLEYRAWHLNVDDMREALKYRVSDNEHLCFANISVNTPISSNTSSCLETMKSYLCDDKVLTFTTDFYTWDYKKLSSQYNESLNGQKVCVKQYDSNNQWNGHAMAIVGYDDNITYDLNSDGVIQDFEKGAFKIVNSHGTSWENQGFVWVMYDALNKVSNASNQNVSGRCPIFDNYAYDIITVAEYPVCMTAEITFMHNNRDDIIVKLGESNATMSTPTTMISTIFSDYINSSYNFSGSGNTSEQGTFVFDYNSLCNANILRKNLYVYLKDGDGELPLVVTNIKLVDDTDKVVVNDDTYFPIASVARTIRYKVGMVGDVDNDANITAMDATAIQRYCSQFISFTDEDLLVADTDGDGYVTSMDATAIQFKLGQYIEYFDGGHYAYLEN